MSSVPTDDPQDLRAAAPERVRLRLFVAGDSARAGLALRSLQALIGSSLPPDTELVVVDILAHPELAEELGVLATPLVIKMSPPPQRRVVGDLADLPRLADALGVDRALHSTDERPHP